MSDVIPADGGVLPRHPGKVLGGNVRGDERKADQRPDKAPACQEEVLTRFFAPALIHAYADDDGKKGDKDRDVSPMHLSLLVAEVPFSWPRIQAFSIMSIFFLSEKQFS
jgi:hypothetical protein